MIKHLFGIVCLAMTITALSGELVPCPHRWQSVISDKPLPIATETVSFIHGSTPDASALYAETFLRKHLATLPSQTGATLNIHLLCGEAARADTPYKLLKITRPQGYALRFVRDKDNIIHAYCLSNGAHGIFYAAVTLSQLITQNGITPKEIDDYPEWEERIMGGYSPIMREQMEDLITWKINSYGIQHRYDWHQFKADAVPKYGRLTYQKYFDMMAQFRQETGNLLDFMMMLNVTIGTPLDASQEEDIQLLLEQCRYAARYVQSIMIQFDDFTKRAPDGTFICRSDGEAARFSTAGKAHGYIGRRIYEMLQQDYPHVKLSVCPAAYALYHHKGLSVNRQNLADLGATLPPEVAIVWTGPSIESTTVNRETYELYKSLVGGHKLMLWDNTSNLPFSHIPLWRTSFFEEMASLDKAIYINGHAFSFFWTKLFQLNANDYLWNSQRFDRIASFQACFELLKGSPLPPIVLQARNELARFSRLPDTEKQKEAPKMLEYKSKFADEKLPFDRMEPYLKRYLNN